MINRAEESGFKVFVTSDQNLSYQQNLTGRHIALLVLSTNYWPTLRDQPSRIQQALVAMRLGQYLEIFFQGTPPLAEIG